MTTPFQKCLRRLVLLLLLSLAGTGAFAQQVIHGANCAGDRFGSDLTCNANDVSITQISINRNYYPGVNVTPQANLLTGAGCVGGTNIVANLNVTVQFSQPDRYDIGIFLAEDGGNPQLLRSGGGAQSCTVSILPRNAATGGTIPNPFGAGTVPSPFLNLNNSTGAYCGDGNGTIPSAAYAAATGAATNTGTATFVVYDVPIPCTANGATSTGKLNVPFVVSWSQLAGNACTSPNDAVPGTKSKCNAPSGTLAEVDVVALPVVAKTNGVSSVSVGDTTTYTITVANTTGANIASQVIKDPSITGLSVSSVSCSAAGSVSCPAVTTSTFASGVTVNNMSNASTLTFTVSGKYTSTGTSTATWVPAAGSQIVNTATSTVGGASNSAIDSDTIYYPSLSTKKTVSAISDPVRGLVANALSIPGSVAQYSIAITNSDTVGKVDADTLQVDDAIPARTYLYYQLSTGATNCTAVGAPVSLAAGASGLSLVAADVQYSSNNGAAWTATPTWTFVGASGTQPPGCYAANITNVRAKPKGRMAANSSFTLNFNVLLQ
ncbi:hypothetical protein [Ramlibacter algicola]|uniref:DUF11 domain-containing protein n=1 Tax=Ramlibacter algicola TaxID=2795217 RepID=A0A934PZP1_9BURK|nr:hypothetical protein [Ramlibacter algicola]MBK0391632.1 hypothetical protein [Ramlibacter algicola]